MNLSGRIKRAVLTAFFPELCPYCDKVIDPEQYACRECKKKLPEYPVTAYVEGGYRCTSPFMYKDCFAESVKRLKFNNRAQYARTLAFAMVNSLGFSPNAFDFDFITCVPMYPEQKNERGYNQSELLAKECADLMNIPYIDALEKFKKNKVQHSLKGRERRSNVRGVYRPVNREKLKDKRILLIDDIITTGSTLAECAKVLKKSGCGDIRCAVVCIAG